MSVKQPAGYSECMRHVPVVTGPAASPQAFCHDKMHFALIKCAFWRDKQLFCRDDSTSVCCNRPNTTKTNGSHENSLLPL